MGHWALGWFLKEGVCVFESRLTGDKLITYGDARMYRGCQDNLDLC